MFLKNHLVLLHPFVERPNSSLLNWEYHFLKVFLVEDRVYIDCLIQSKWVLIVLFNSDMYKSAPSVATVIIASSLFKFIYFASLIEAIMLAIAENPTS